MKPVKFKDQNTVFAENQDEYENLPALIINDEKGYVVSCWKLSFGERLKLLFTGRMWLSLMMFGKPLTPSHLSVHRRESYSKVDDDSSRWKRFKTRFFE